MPRTCTGRLFMDKWIALKMGQIMTGILFPTIAIIFSLVALFTCRCSSDILRLFKSPEVQQFMYGGEKQSKPNFSIKKVCILMK